MACDGGSATVLLNQYLSMDRGNTRPTYDVVIVATKRTESGEKNVSASFFMRDENKGFMRLQLMSREAEAA